jgi:sortase A
MTSLLAASATAPTQPEALMPAAVATPTPAATLAAPSQAPEAGKRREVPGAASQRAPQSPTSLYLALAEAVQTDVNAQRMASVPTAPTVELVAEAEGRPPDRIRSEAIDLDVQIVPVGWKQVLRDGKMVSMWEVGSYRASWHKTSAMPGQPGNMVITGHNNIEGSVFRRVPDLQTGDAIVVEAAGRPFTYTVASMFVVREKGATPEQKAWNGQWIGSFPDARLTLVTCYPPDGNSHRMIVIAKPAGR